LVPLTLSAPVCAARRELWPFVPGTVDDVLVIEPAVDPRRVLGWLAASPVRERSELAGEGNRSGGSGGALGSFLEVGRHFLKTRRTARFETLERALAVELPRERQRRATGVYSPQRIWFVSRGADGACWACSLAPTVPVLRDRFEAGAGPEAWQGYAQAIRLTLQLAAEQRIWLDCNPNNFGFEDDALYYLDDDLPAMGATTAVFQALLRLREYPAAAPADRLGFVEEVVALALAHLEAPGLRAALARDLAQPLLWPADPALRRPLAQLLAAVESTRPRDRRAPRPFA
jgi:hypothetical protein